MLSFDSRESSFRPSTPARALTLSTTDRVASEWLSAYPGRVLVVDDEASSRRLLRKALSSFGHAVDEASNGVDALRLADGSHDLVLMDVRMPGPNGFEVAKQLRGRPETAHIPIVMVTGVDSHEDRLHAVANGANDFIGKPFELTELFLRAEAQLSLKASADSLKKARAELEDEVARRTADLRTTVDELTESHARVRRAQLDTVRSLVLAAEFKDGETAAHIERISLYSAVLARGLGLSPQKVQLIQEASPMHDVGKIGIPDAILQKPGPLTAQERLTMESHTEIGAKILEDTDSEMLQLGSLIAHCHHERWDGSGYPSGLSGEAIPFEARLVSVVDVFDAVTSDRHYRMAMPNVEAYAMMQEGRGRHFDPDMLDAFFDQSSEIEEVQRTWTPESWTLAV